MWEAGVVSEFTRDLPMGCDEYDRMEPGTERYGVEQRTIGDDAQGWYGGWPSYATRDEAQASVDEYNAWSPRAYELRVRVFRSEPPMLHRLDKL